MLLNKNSSDIINHLMENAMVWRKIKKSRVTKAEYREGALYGIYFLIGLSLLSWAIQTIQGAEVA